MSKLDPKPPELLQHLEWLRLNWRRYKGVVALGAVVVACIVVVPQIEWESVSRAFSSQVQEQPEVSGPSLLVRFKDGPQKRVSFSMQFQLDQDRVIDSFKRFGSAEAAIDSLKSSVRGAAYTVLEAYSEDYVRTNRRAVADQIVAASKRAEDDTAYKIVELSILEIQ